jgi:competence protein ComEA
MEHANYWWRRPTILAALVCALSGAAILFLGPTLRMTAGAQPSAAPTTGGASALLEQPIEPDPVEEDLVAITIPPEPTFAIVYISGAVERPDVYRLPGDARVKDVVLAAGGLSADAASEQINLAAPISDAQHIHIPRTGEQSASPVGTTDPAIAAPSSSGLLNLNSASQADLEDLPGIGATLAERIIAYREENGPFMSVEDLRKVSGIGEKLFERIAVLVTV